MEINKVQIFDSGANYSVLSTLSHKDVDSNIELSDLLEIIETVGCQSLNIKGTGKMAGIPAVYAPDASISMTSVQKFCAERNAVIMFRKDEAIGVQKKTRYNKLKLKR